MKNTVITLIVITFSLTATGCATIFSKGYDEIKFESEPSGAKVYLDAEYLGTTPVIHNINRDTFGTRYLTFKKEGYEPKKVPLEKSLNSTALWNFGFITTSFGATSWGIDALSGKMTEYSPKSYLIELERADNGKKESKNEGSISAVAFAVGNFQALKKDLARHDGESLRLYHALSMAHAMPYDEFVRRTTRIETALLEQKDGLALHRAIQLSLVMNGRQGS